MRVQVSLIDTDVEVSFAPARDESAAGGGGARRRINNDDDDGDDDTAAGNDAVLASAPEMMKVGGATTGLAESGSPYSRTTTVLRIVSL